VFPEVEMGTFPEVTEDEDNDVVTVLMERPDTGSEFPPISISPHVLEPPVQHVVTTAPRARTGGIVRVLGILSLGVLVGAGAGVGAMFLPVGAARTAAATAPRIEASPAAAPLPAAPAATQVAPLTLEFEVDPPVAPAAAPEPKVAAPKPAIAATKRRPRSAKPSVVPVSAPAGDADPQLAATAKAAAEAQDLERAQLDALMR
jgi:hypothetical protein